MSARQATITLTPIADDTARRIAHILGGCSAMGQALAEVERRRAAGETVRIYQTGQTILVGPPVAADPTP